jgi:hypothetical protein
MIKKHCWFKDFVQPKKRGGGVKRGTVPIDSSRHNDRYFIFYIHFKGYVYSFAWISKNQFQHLIPRTHGILFYVTCATKYSEALCDVALLLLAAIWESLKSLKFFCAYNLKKSRYKSTQSSHISALNILKNQISGFRFYVFFAAHTFNKKSLLWKKRIF